MSFQRFDSSPPPGERIGSKRPHLSVFRFASFQSTSRIPSQTPPAYSPDDILASRNQLQAKVLHWMRIAISAVTLLASVVIIACAASALRTYTSTRDNAEWVLPLWPASVDLRPTHAVLACGVILALASILYLIAALAPTPFRSPRVLNIIFTILAFVSVFITIFTTVFASTIDTHLSNSTQAGTLASWTCKWQGFGSAAPGNFSEICGTSTAASDLVILMIVIEMFSVLLAGWGWWVGARLKKAGREGKGQGISV
ncbi:MAG: hypothetical protein LQ338_005326 [Usnochroma carphineum]|nr:MAG: hypothetical protein LQ338_005326 [Usnochroma carphineum]